MFLDDRIVVHGTVVTNDGATVLGWRSFTITNLGADPSLWTYTLNTIPATTRLLDGSVIDPGDGYVYFTTERQFPSTPVTLARVPRADLKNGVYTALRWWTGIAWSALEADHGTFIDDVLHNERTVLSIGGRWMEITGTEPGFLWLGLRMGTANLLDSVTARQIPVHAFAPETGGNNDYYATRAHPEQETDSDGLMVTYIADGTFANMLANPNLYRPRVLLVTPPGP